MTSDDKKRDSKAVLTLSRVAPTALEALQHLTVPSPTSDNRKLARLRRQVEEYVPDNADVRALSNGDPQLQEKAAAALVLGSVLRIPIRSAVDLIQEQRRLHPEASKGDIYLRVLTILRDKKPFGKMIGSLAENLLKEEGP